MSTHQVLLLIKLLGGVQMDLFSDQGLFGFSFAHGAQNFTGNDKGGDQQAGVNKHDKAEVHGVVPGSGDAEVAGK